MFKAYPILQQKKAELSNEKSAELACRIEAYHANPTVGKLRNDMKDKYWQFIPISSN